MLQKIAKEMLKDPDVKEAADKFYKIGRKQAHDALVYYQKVAQGEVVAPEDLSEEEAAALAQALAAEEGVEGEEEMPDEEEGAQLASDLITQAIIDQAEETPELVPDDIQQDLVDAAIATLGGEDVVAALGEAAADEGAVEEEGDEDEEDEDMVTAEDIKSASLLHALLGKGEQ